jgi:hypothetical protein
MFETLSTVIIDEVRVVEISAALFPSDGAAARWYRFHVTLLKR